MLLKGEKTSFSFCTGCLFPECVTFAHKNQQGILPEIPGNNTEIINCMLNFALKKDTL